MDSKKLSMHSDVIEKDVDEILNDDLPWEQLSGKTIVITGANGMLAAYIVETLLTLNDRIDKSIRVIALVRNVDKAMKRFCRWKGCLNLIVRQWQSDNSDIGIEECNILIHAASIPRPDSKIPVDVIVPNVIGSWNLLNYCRTHCRKLEQFIFFSSGAVYGDNFTDDSRVSESQFFPINQMDPVSCYAESKRMGENLCVSFMRQYGIPVKILRYAHTYGPGMDLAKDPRSFVYFVNCVLSGKDIELQTSGEMVRYFCYITDATRAFFHILFRGRNGEAFNIANNNGKTSICELAKMIARLGNSKSRVILNVTNTKVPGYSPQQYAFHPDTQKLQTLGFAPRVNVSDGFSRVLQYYGSTRSNNT